MDQIEKNLLDIIFIHPIDEKFFCKLSDRKYSLKQSIIFIRKFIKSNN
jgi:hypothetical protein